MSKASSKQCVIKGCTKKSHARGLCPMHYQRQRRGVQDKRDSGYDIGIDTSLEVKPIDLLSRKRTTNDDTCHREPCVEEPSTSRPRFELVQEETGDTNAFGFNFLADNPLWDFIGRAANMDSMLESLCLSVKSAKTAEDKLGHLSTLILVGMCYGRILSAGDKGKGS